MDLPIMMFAVLATQPRRKRPIQMRGKLLNIVSTEAKIATVWIKIVARLRPFIMISPPNRLPRINPTIEILLMAVFQKVNSSSVQPKKT